MNRIKNNKQGFTLIEVVLVLAIGGLIFLLAFLAFQQVSTNRRDTQRRSDAGRIVAELQNAGGDGVTVDTQTKLTGSTTVPAPSATAPSNTGFVGSYLGGGLKGPQQYYGYTYSNSTTALTAAQTAKDLVTIGSGVKCAVGVNNQFATQAGAVAVIMGLEKGAVCRDDQ